MRNRFEPGNSFSLGRPKGAKNRLHREFIEALHADFKVHGPAVIEVVRKEDPGAYLRVIASVLPKELEVSQATADLTDSDLEAIIVETKARLLAPPVEQPLLMIEHEHVQREEDRFTRRNCPLCCADGPGGSVIASFILSRSAPPSLRQPKTQKAFFAAVCKPRFSAARQ